MAGGSGVLRRVVAPVQKWEKRANRKRKKVKKKSDIKPRFCPRDDQSAQICSASLRLSNRCCCCACGTDLTSCASTNPSIQMVTAVEIKAEG